MTAGIRTRGMESMSIIARRLRGQKWSRPTTYRGIEFRSYLESRFAFHLDEMDEEWIYEPRTYGPRGRRYLPDFEIVSAPRPTFVEVKPTRAEVDAAQTKMAVIWESVPDAHLIVVCAEGSAFFSARLGEKWREWQERWRYE